MDDTATGEHSHGLAALTVISLVAGAACGLPGTIFRFSLGATQSSESA